MEVIICTLEGHPVGTVPFLYAQILCPDLVPSKEPVRFNAVQPNVLLEAIQHQRSIIPTLWAEVKLLTQLEIDHFDLRLMIRNRLVLFLELMTTRIASQPAEFLPSVSKKDCRMLREILAFIPEAEQTIVIGLMERSPFISALKGTPHLTEIGLEILIAEECRWIETGDSVDPSSSFIFDLESFTCLSANPEASTRAHQNIVYFVGPYVDDLDLSQSFLTGDAIRAAVLQTGVDHLFETSSDQIEILFPIILTSMDPADHERIRIDDPRGWSLQITDGTHGCATRDSSLPFRWWYGSRVTLGVDPTLSVAEVQTIAQNHYATIRTHYPFVKFKTEGPCQYLIYTDDLAHLSKFRPVEILQCEWVIHSGIYTSKWNLIDDIPYFYLPASAVWMSKYFEMSPGTTPTGHPYQNLMWVSEDPPADVKLSYLPFHGGKNIPGSLFAAQVERPYFMRDLDALRAKMRTVRANLITLDPEGHGDSRDQILAALDQQEAILDRYK